MTDSDNSAEYSPRLDLLSTSQKICIFSAPYIAHLNGDKSTIFQVCCNHWECPRCGEMRAKHEYGRIVNGAKLLDSTHTLYFYTFTCRGRDLSLSDAQQNYLLWTNRLLSTMRARCKIEGGCWCYVQVTERQKRGHPHSHLLMAWVPSDAILRYDKKGKPYYYSRWFYSAHKKAGLGTQSKITPVGSAEATAKYIAKYLFKDAMFTAMPKNWKRVRYSHSFPDAPQPAALQTGEYMMVETPQQWRKLELSGLTFRCDDMSLWAVASKHVRKVTRGWLQSGSLT